MKISRKTCHHCQVSIEANFSDQPLSGLPEEHQRFIEMFVLASGSLKEIASQTGVSYPTVRNRLDKVIELLSSEIAHQETEPQAGDVIKQIKSDRNTTRLEP